jgi:hypothetical protein
MAALVVPGVLIAADRKREKPLPPGELVEIFSGIENGKIEVQLIPKDSTRCRLLVKNKTDRPLNVLLPPALAGVPVLAQWGNQNNVNQNNLPQNLGIGVGQGINGPMNPGPMNPGPMNIGAPHKPKQNGVGPILLPGPVFNIPPEKVGRWKLASVCLDHGKPTPRPQMQYQIKPIEQCAARPAVTELCAMLGRGEVNQRVAQLAAWHLNNNMGWTELAGLRHRSTFGDRPAYSRTELGAGKRVAEKAVALAEKQEAPRGIKGASAN